MMGQQSKHNNASNGPTNVIRPNRIPNGGNISSSDDGCSSSAYSHGSLRLLISLDAYRHRDDASGTMPNVPSLLLSCCVGLMALLLSEMFWRLLILWFHQQHWFSTEILENELHRHILARHIGVDASACLLCVFLAWRPMMIQHAGHTLPSSVANFLLRNSNNNSKHNKHNDLPDYQAWPAVEKRVYGYQPAACRLCLFFIIYQIKNLHDAILWNDGPEFVFHHVFSILTVYGNVGYGCAGYYGYFYFGVSELSTAVLCLLANFDDDYGLPGLGSALPTLKVVNAVCFVMLFITCRCVLWPFVSFCFLRDVRQALDKIKYDKMEQKTRSTGSQAYLYFFMVSLSLLSFLQVLWLGQIFVLAQQELVKAGYELF